MTTPPTPETLGEALPREMAEAETLLTAKARLLLMSPRQKEEALLNLLSFMCSDDDGNWDEAKAERLRRACAETVAKEGSKP